MGRSGAGNWLKVETYARRSLAFADTEGGRSILFAQNRQHKRGKNRYTLAQFELEAAEIERSFADYRARFLGA